MSLASGSRKLVTPPCYLSSNRLEVAYLYTHGPIVGSNYPNSHSPRIMSVNMMADTAVRQLSYGDRRYKSSSPLNAVWWLRSLCGPESKWESVSGTRSRLGCAGSRSEREVAYCGKDPVSNIDGGAERERSCPQITGFHEQCRGATSILSISAIASD